MDLIVRKEVRAVAMIQHRVSLGASWQQRVIKISSSNNRKSDTPEGTESKETLLFTLRAPWVGYRALSDNRSPEALPWWLMSEPRAASTPADSIPLSKRCFSFLSLVRNGQTLAHSCLCWTHLLAGELQENVCWFHQLYRLNVAEPEGRSRVGIGPYWVLFQQTGKVARTSEECIQPW